MKSRLLKAIMNKKETMEDIEKGLVEWWPSEPGKQRIRNLPRRKFSDIFDQAHSEANKASLSRKTLIKDDVPPSPLLPVESGVQKLDLQEEVKKLLCEDVREMCVCGGHNNVPAPSSPTLASTPRTPAARKMILGQSEEAAQGLKPFIGLTDKDLEGDDKAISNMQDEFIRNGSLQDLQNFYYVCYGHGQNQNDMPDHVKDDIKRGTYHGGLLLPGEYDDGNRDLTLNDFKERLEASLSGLTKAHVLALRLYSTSSYKRFNQPLRERQDPHPFKITVYELDEGLRKLRTVMAKNDPLEFSSPHRIYRWVICMRVQAGASAHTYVCFWPHFAHALHLLRL